jgi:predicted RNase H-like HicB family nuclease
MTGRCPAWRCSRGPVPGVAPRLVWWDGAGIRYRAIGEDYPHAGVLHTIIITNQNRSYLIMKTLIEVNKEGKYFVAIDLLTNVADQGLSESEAVQNLRKGLEEHYQLLIELTPRDHKLTCLDIEVDNLVKNSPAVSS